MTRRGHTSNIDRSRALTDGVAFWRSPFDRTNRNERFLDLFHGRVWTDHPFQPHLQKLVGYLPAGSTVRVLDVGSGPVSHVGTISDRWRVQITAVNPLAAEYIALCEEFGLARRNGVVDQAGEAETLTESFTGESFDIVHCRNALDHARDPLLGIRQMVAVCKVGGHCYLAHATNEGEKQRYDGLHQWNLSPREDGDLAIWAQERQQILLRDALRGAATVQAVSTGAWHTVTIRKQPGD